MRQMYRFFVCEFVYANDVESNNATYGIGWGLFIGC